MVGSVKFGMAGGGECVIERAIGVVLAAVKTCDRLGLGVAWNSSGVANENAASSSSINGTGSTDLIGSSSSLSSLRGNGEGDAGWPKLNVESSSSSALKPKPMLKPPGELSDFKDGIPTEDSTWTAPSESSRQVKKLSTEGLGLARFEALASDQTDKRSR